MYKTVIQYVLYYLLCRKFLYICKLVVVVWFENFLFLLVLAGLHVKYTFLVCASLSHVFSLPDVLLLLVVMGVLAAGLAWLTWLAFCIKERMYLYAYYNNFRLFWENIDIHHYIGSTAAAQLTIHTHHVRSKHLHSLILIRSSQKSSFIHHHHIIVVHKIFFPFDDDNNIYQLKGCTKHTSIIIMITMI